MAAEEVSVIALVENLELPVPRRPPARFARQPGLPAATTRVVELALKQQRAAETPDRINGGFLNKTNKSNGVTDNAERHQSLEILRRLPPGTVLIKQVEANTPKEMEEERTTSEETSSERPRKLSQRIRNKKPLEVRRNPMRSASRKEPPSKDGRSSSGTASSSRQRLLAARRRGAGNLATESATGAGAKRTRSTPYMNTRSVTRKLYNVGATYEAPTRRDETQWKEWPVHGMHERPVYHPQFGLAAEYNGRLFASFDGEGYREITPEAQQIEIVRVDPRVDSLDGGLPYPRSTAAVRPKLLAAPTTIAAHPKTDKPRLASLCGYVRPFEHLQSSFCLSQQQQQQQQQLRNLERLQHLENLQRLGSRVRLQSPEGCQVKLAAGRLLSTEMFRNLQNATLSHAQQSPVAASTQANPSKCLIVPRSAATPIALPFCGVQTFKNPKGKLFFVRAPDTPKKPLAEKSSTITSASQSLGSAAWAESSLRKRLEGPPIEAARLYAPLSQQKQRQPVARGFPPIRLAESTGMFRPKVAAPREDHGHADYAAAARPSLADDGHMPEVLDLSKKEPPRQPANSEVVRPKEEKNVSQTYTTDLVRYFQNFGADEGMDLFEDPKNLT